MADTLGREQPYIDGNGTGFYDPTEWLDQIDVVDSNGNVTETIQEGTPVDQQHLNNAEAGIEQANLYGELLASHVRMNREAISNLTGEVLNVTLTNTSGDDYFNNSQKTVALATPRDTTDYAVTVEVQSDPTNVGDVVITDKQVNGFKVKYTGSAKTASLRLFVAGGNAL